jgi:hypothetical protein
MGLLAVLPQLLPGAIAWAQAQSNHVAAVGLPLIESGLVVARRVGVRFPEQIRIKLVEQLPMPEEPMLKQAAIETGLLGPHMAGLTLGYSILICEGQFTGRLLSHECRHVYQYETFGSIAAFLPVYLQQIAEVGYDNAQFELDARAHEFFT